MSNFSIIIVDDEPAQQKTLLDMLRHFPNYRVIERCYGVDEGVSKIRSLKPDLVFLDVVMPPKTGFDLLNELDEFDFHFIFTTSFEEFALRAFRVSAVDYLLKPFGMDDLSDALKKFESISKREDSAQHIKVLRSNINDGLKNNNKIALPVMSGFTFVNIGDIVRCEADDAYTTFYLRDGSQIVVSKQIKDCESLLEEYGFCRIHNSHMVNINCVVQYIKGDGGQVKLTDGKVLDVSRRKKDDFLNLFKKI